MRFVAAAVVLALLAGACGDDDEPEPSGASETTVTTSASTTTVPDTPPAPAAGAVELAADVEARVPAGPVTWTLEVTNVTDAPVTITFPTAQVADAIVRRDDAVVRRWSDGRFFTQQVQQVTLAPGETRPFEIADDLTGLEPGSYSLELRLTVVAPPEPVTERIRVVEPG